MTSILISFGFDEVVCKQLHSELVFECTKSKQDVVRINEILLQFTPKDISIIREYIDSPDSEAELYVIERFKQILVSH